VFNLTLIAGLQLALAQLCVSTILLIIQGNGAGLGKSLGYLRGAEIWDERRLIRCYSGSLKTRSELDPQQRAQIIGTVCIWVDYRMPLQPLRETARRPLMPPPNGTSACACCRWWRPASATCSCACWYPANSV
jgi:hypothetical protein